jgi:hypothetical protein
VAVVCLGLITSCQKKAEDLIVGKWNAKSYSEHTTYASGATRDYNFTYDPGECVLEFKSDQTYTFYLMDTLYGPYQYSIGDDKLTMKDQTGTFSLSETSLISTIERDVTGGISGNYHISSTSVYER